MSREVSHLKVRPMKEPADELCHPQPVSRIGRLDQAARLFDDGIQQCLAAGSE
jgi:hypothetical protein